jgi:hypothetical protein
MPSFAKVSSSEETVGHFAGMEPFTARQIQNLAASLQSESQKQQIYIGFSIPKHQRPDNNI